MQERRKSIANALELRLSCTRSSMLYDHSNSHCALHACKMVRRTDFECCFQTMIDTAMCNPLSPLNIHIMKHWREFVWCFCSTIMAMACLMHIKTAYLMHYRSLSMNTISAILCWQVYRQLIWKGYCRRERSIYYKYAHVLLCMVLLCCVSIWSFHRSTISWKLFGIINIPKLYLWSNHKEWEQRCDEQCWFFHDWHFIHTYMFVVVSSDAMEQASDFRIGRRQVVFLCWMQDSNPGSQSPNRQQTECPLTNRLSYRGSS